MLKKDMVWSARWVWVALVLAACVIYAVGMTHEGFWYDEAYSAMIAERDALEIVRLTAQDIHPPLYYLLLGGVQTVLGDSEWAMRLLSVLGAVAMVGLGAGPVRRMYGDATARLYAVLVLATPAILIYAHEARSYALLMPAVTAATTYGYLAARDNRGRDWVCFGLTSLAAAYLHYYGVIAVFCVYLFLGIWLVSVGRRGGKVLLVTAAGVFLAYLPWMTYFLSQVLRVRRAFWIAPVNVLSVLGGFCVPFSYKDFYPPVCWSIVAAMCLFGALTVFGTVFALLRRTAEERVLILLPVLVFDGTLLIAVVVSLVLAPVYFPRYMIACVGPALLVLSMSIRLIPARPVRAGAIGLFILLNLLVIRNVYTQRFNGLMREACDELACVIRPSDLVVTSDCFALGPAVYYLRDARHLFYMNDTEAQWRQIYTVFQPRVMGRDRLDDALASSGALWIIESNSGLSISPEQVLANANDAWRRLDEPRTYAHPCSRFAFTVSRYVPIGRNAPHAEEEKNAGGQEQRTSGAGRQ